MRAKFVSGCLVVLIIAIIGLVVFLVFISNDGIGVSAATITVDDSGGAQYTKIQDAIDDADVGDTILVYNGTYHESITINKKISIIGEDKHSSVIDACGKDFAVKITSDYVIFENFFVKNAAYVESFPPENNTAHFIFIEKEICFLIIK